MLLLLLLTGAVACQQDRPSEANVVTTDIDLFWNAYDAIIQETDTILQMQLIDSLYLKRGTKGLQELVKARNSTPKDYVALINQYPKFWKSIRANTYQSKELAVQLSEGIQKLKAIYPSLRPAKIYFGIGTMRTNGTTRDSLVLIGSELAMADSTIDISEFEGRTQDWLKGYFAGNPIEEIVLLNIHEYVHTQQNPIPNNLLHQVLYEGVAEFVSVLAMGVPSGSPAIDFGKNNPAVKEKFEAEMFYERTYEWMWSNAPNEFNTRDLGYYIGYAIAEMHYEQADNKTIAIQELIKIDYSDPKSVDHLIDNTHFFTQPIDTLRRKDAAKRPTVTAIQPPINGNQNVDPNTQQITIQFSMPLNGYHTSVKYGALGEAAFPTITNGEWATHQQSWTMQVELQPNTAYQFWIGDNFRTDKDTPLMPYYVDFKTSDE